MWSDINDEDDGACEYAMWSFKMLVNCVVVNRFNSRDTVTSFIDGTLINSSHKGHVNDNKKRVAENEHGFDLKKQKVCKVLIGYRERILD